MYIHFQISNFPSASIDTKSDDSVNEDTPVSPKKPREGPEPCEGPIDTVGLTPITPLVANGDGPITPSVAKGDDPITDEGIRGIPSTSSKNMQTHPRANKPRSYSRKSYLKGMCANFKDPNKFKKWGNRRWKDPVRQKEFWSTHHKAPIKNRQRANADWIISQQKNVKMSRTRSQESMLKEIEY